MHYGFISVMGGKKCKNQFFTSTVVCWKFIHKLVLFWCNSTLAPRCRLKRLKVPMKACFSSSMPWHLTFWIRDGHEPSSWFMICGMPHSWNIDHHKLGLKSWSSVMDAPVPFSSPELLATPSEPPGILEAELSFSRVTDAAASEVTDSETEDMAQLLLSSPADLPVCHWGNISSAGMMWSTESQSKQKEWDYKPSTTSAVH